MSDVSEGVAVGEQQQRTGTWRGWRSTGSCANEEPASTAQAPGRGGLCSAGAIADTCALCPTPPSDSASSASACGALLAKAAEADEEDEEGNEERLWPAPLASSAEALADADADASPETGAAPSAGVAAGPMLRTVCSGRRPAAASCCSFSRCALLLQCLYRLLFVLNAIAHSLHEKGRSFVWHRMCFTSTPAARSTETSTSALAVHKSLYVVHLQYSRLTPHMLHSTTLCVLFLPLASSSRLQVPHAHATSTCITEATCNSIACAYASRFTRLDSTRQWERET